MLECHSNYSVTSSWTAWSTIRRTSGFPSRVCPHPQKHYHSLAKRKCLNEHIHVLLHLFNPHEYGARNLVSVYSQYYFEIVQKNLARTHGTYSNWVFCDLYWCSSNLCNPRTIQFKYLLAETISSNIHSKHDMYKVSIHLFLVCGYLGLPLKL